MMAARRRGSAPIATARKLAYAVGHLVGINRIPQPGPVPGGGRDLPTSTFGSATLSMSFRVEETLSMAAPGACEPTLR